jgi:hypothetical protein
MRYRLFTQTRQVGGSMFTQTLQVGGSMFNVHTDTSGGWVGIHTEHHRLHRHREWVFTHQITDRVRVYRRPFVRNIRVNGRLFTGNTYGRVFTVWQRLFVPNMKVSGRLRTDTTGEPLASRT